MKNEHRPSSSSVFKKAFSLILCLTMVMAAIPFSASAAEESYLYIGEQKYTASAEGEGWSLKVEDGKFSLTLDSADELLIYKQGHFSVHNCELEISVRSENTFRAGYAEGAAPYDIYAFYAENSNITICSDGILKVDTKENKTAVPFYLVDSVLTFDGASTYLDCAGDAFVLINSKVNLNAGELFINGEKMTTDDSGALVPAECEHIDIDPEDGICDICGEVLYEPEPQPPAPQCPLCPVYEKYKDSFILNFVVIFIHRVVHTLWMIF